MTPGARTPEELETLFEDAFVIRDGDALVQLFEHGAVLVAGDGPAHARGAAEIARFAAALWDRDLTYLADPRRVLQSGSTALVVGERAINVLRRGTDGAWRYAITLLSLGEITTKKERL
jgi:ketosteroid isomerase-like protein